MKITCQSCQAKYTIADEKVVGKTVKIKCKKCGAAIVVNANDPSAVADPHGHAPEPEEDDGTTRVFSGESPMAGPDWTVNVRDDDQRTMSPAQIAQAFAAGTITGDTYVWRDGMADWQPLSQVAELQAALAAPAAPVPAAPAGTSDDDLNATVAMNPEAAAAHYAPVAAAAPAAAASPAAARKAGRAGQDLFGGGGDGGSPFGGGGGGASGSVAPPKPSDHRAVGERNENSVLFSLASLTATEKAAAAPDLGPKKKTSGRSGLDDIMNIGGGGGMGGAMLAPPPIMAPVIEPPPPQIAPQPAPQMAAMPGSMPPPAMGAMGAMNPMVSYPPPAQKKTPVGLIIGIVVGVLALVGVVGFLATSGGDKDATAENGTTANSAAATGTQTAAPTTTTTTTAAPTPTETVAANNTAPTNTAPPAGADPGTTTKSTSGGTAPAGTGTGKPSGTAPTATATTTATATATATAEPPPSGGGAEFNRAAASSALNGASGAARGCKKPDGPTGTARVRVTFAPSGSVTQSVVQGAPFAGTPVGSCIAGAFRSARVPPFEGSPVSVTKSVTIN